MPRHDSTAQRKARLRTKAAARGAQVIFDNFAKILKLCLQTNQQQIADLVLDTRMVWEMCLHAEHEVSSFPLSRTSERMGLPREATAEGLGGRRGEGQQGAGAVGEAEAEKAGDDRRRRRNFL